MKKLVFDTSSIISLATNDLLWVLKELKNKYNMQFYISEAVKEELIDRPMMGKLYKLEAIMIMSFIKDGVLNILDGKTAEKRDKLIYLANHVFRIRDEWLNIVHKGEMGALALASELNADAYIVDERTTRLLIENPKKLAKILKNKLKASVGFNGKAFREFQKEIGKIKVIRSCDLMTVSFENGLLDKYIENENMKESLLDGLLWGLKLRGCSLSINEIDDIMRIEGFRKRF